MYLIKCRGNALKINIGTPNVIAGSAQQWRPLKHSASAHHIVYVLHLFYLIILFYASHTVCGYSVVARLRKVSLQLIFGAMYLLLLLQHAGENYFTEL